MDVIMHLTKCSEGSTIASSRIALFLKDHLGLPLVDDEESFNAVDLDNLDTVLMVNSMSAFSKILPQAQELAKYCRRLVWIQNDYTVYPPTQVRKIFAI